MAGANLGADVSESLTELQAERRTLPGAPGRAVVADYYQGDPHFRFHYHPEFELVLTRGSVGKRLVGDRTEEYSTLDLCLFGPSLPHTLVAESAAATDRPKDNLVLQFTCESLGLEMLSRPEAADVRGLLAEAGRGLAFSRDVAAQVEEEFEHAVHAVGFAQYLATLRVLSDLADSRERRLLLRSETRGRSSAAADQERLIRVLSFVHDAHERRVTLEDAARTVAMSVPTFTRFFKRATGATFFHYLNQWRVRRAGILLQRTDRQVVDIAGTVGFANLSHFNRQFRKLMGCTPREFRRRGADGDERHRRLIKSITN